MWPFLHLVQLWYGQACTKNVWDIFVKVTHPILFLYIYIYIICVFKNVGFIGHGMLGLAIMCCKLFGWNYALYLATVLAPRRVCPLRILKWPLPQATDQECPWPSRVVVSDFFLYCSIQSLSRNWSPWLYSGVHFLMIVLKNPKLAPYCGKQ